LLRVRALANGDELVRHGLDRLSQVGKLAGDKRRVLSLRHLPGRSLGRGVKADTPRTLRTFWISEGSRVTDGLYRGLGVKTWSAVDGPMRVVDEALLERLRTAVGDSAAAYIDADEHVAAVLRLLAHAPGTTWELPLSETDAAMSPAVLPVPR
jgi:hypothetical protein